MDNQVVNTTGLALAIEFIDETETERKESLDHSPPTSGIGEDDSAPSTSTLPYSSSSSIEKDHRKSLTNVVANPCNEVTFADEKDSIISSAESDNEGDASEFGGSKKPKIPDGGWGWVVVFASMIISMIADGISFSFGLLYIEFLHEFKESKSKTAWIGSLFMAVPLLSGPIMSALVDKFGCRAMTITGGLISGFGFVISAYVNSIEVMFLTFGVISGLGLGLCYVTAVVSIAFWFDKKRNSAVGLGACGTGIGTFVYAPMTQFFIDEYGWRGTTLLLAGTFFNMCVCGALMRDPLWWTIEQSKNSLNGSKSIKNASSCGSVSSKSGAEENSNFPGFEEIRNMLKNGKTHEYMLTALSTSTDSPNDSADKSECRSVVNIPTFIKQNEKVPLEVLEALSGNKKLYNVILENYPSLLLCRSTSDKGLNVITEDLHTTTRIPLTMSMKVKKVRAQNSSVSQDGDFDDVTANTPLMNLPTAKAKPQLIKSAMRTDPSTGPKKHLPINSNYLKHIRIHRNSVMYRGAMLNIHKYRLRASSCPNIYKNSMTTLAKENEEKWYGEFLELLKGMCDFSMFLELHFLLMSLSTILLFTWFIVPYFYLAEHLTHYGYTEADASKILSIIGITNTIGMVTLGWAGDQPWMNVMKTYTACLILCGISTLCMIYFSTNYVLLVISSGCFGLFFAGNFSFTPVILVELVPLERFTTAYGLILLCQGIGNLLGPPLAGFIFDVTGAWETSFTQAGLWIIVAGILMAIIPYTKNRKILGSGPLEKDNDSTV